MWSAEYWVLFASEVTYGSGLASIWIAGGEAAGSTTLAAIGWLQHLADRNRCSRPASKPSRTSRSAHRDVWARWRQSAGPVDDDPPRWLTLAMTVGVIAALAAWGFTTRFTAILLAVMVDIMAACVNASKTYRHPAGESMLSWWLFLAATIAALLAAGGAAPILYAYPGAGALTAIAVIAAWITGRQAGFAVTSADRVKVEAGHHQQSGNRAGGKDHGKSVSLPAMRDLEPDRIPEPPRGRVRADALLASVFPPCRRE